MARQRTVNVQIEVYEDRNGWLHANPVSKTLGRQSRRYLSDYGTFVTARDTLIFIQSEENRRDFLRDIQATRENRAHMRRGYTFRKNVSNDVYWRWLSFANEVPDEGHEPKGRQRLSVRKEAGEWVVVWYDARGRRDEGKTYYALDKADAVDTARAMQREMDRMY